MDYTKQMEAFTNGDADHRHDLAGHHQPAQGAEPPVPVEVVKPNEGATGWSDTWMINSKTKHINCAYKWLEHIVSPKVNAQVAEWFGEAPGNSKACALRPVDPEPLRPVPRQRRRVLEGRLVLADARDEVRRRPDRRDVQGLRRLGQGLDGDQGLSPAADRDRDRPGRALGGSRPLCYRP